MKKISDYIYYNYSWQQEQIGIKPNEQFTVVKDVGDLKQGDLVTFVGYDDVDNHYGIFVFTNAKNEVLEVSGDFSCRQGAGLTGLKEALEKFA